MSQIDQTPGKLLGKVAIVTGASRGIGRAIALRLGKDGAKVIVGYSRQAEKAQEVVAAIEKEGGQAVAVQADMGNLADVRRLFEEARQRFGKLDILVNNAGISAFKPIAMLTEEDFDRMFTINTKGPLFALQQAAHQIADGGRIINISTGGTATSAPGAGLYTASKAALEQFTMSLAKELGSRGVTVNAVLPGMTETDMFEEVAPPEFKEMAIGMTALGRLGKPEDIADVVAFLASDDARWITGQKIAATGGM